MASTVRAASGLLLFYALLLSAAGLNLATVGGGGCLSHLRLGLQRLQPLRQDDAAAASAAGTPVRALNGRLFGGRGFGGRSGPGPLAMNTRYYGGTYDRWGDNSDEGGGRMQRRVKRQWPLSLTQTLLAINVVMFLGQQVFPAITFWGVKDAGRIFYRSEYHRLVTPMFLHGGIGHLLMNSFSLKNLGELSESFFGARNTLFIYLCSGVAGNVLSLFMTPNPSLGASGAIFGLGGACAAWLIKNKPALNSSGDAMLKSIGFNLAINLYFGMTSRMIDNAGHIGGLLGGAAVAFMLTPPPQRRRRRY